MWVWGEEDRFLKRGREGMLVITDVRIAFVTKTNMLYRNHDTYSLEQLKRFETGDYDFHPLVGYKIKHLEYDLEKSVNNLSFPFNQVVSIAQEKKRWGTRLKVVKKLSGVNMLKTYKFAVAKGWVKYPVKDPVQFQHVNWIPIIKLFERYKGVTGVFHRCKAGMRRYYSEMVRWISGCRLEFY